MEIKSISQKIFKTNSSVETKSNHTNPFGVNFKGNMINADVFEPSFEGTKETLAQKAANKLSGVRNKLADAMNVGSINSFVSRNVDAVVDFGRRIKAGASDLWKKAQNLDVEFPIYENIKEARTYSRSALDSTESKALGEMWQSLLATV